MMHRLNVTIVIRHLSRFARLMRLNRPIGIWLLLWPTLWGLWIASSGQPDQTIFIVFVVGTLVMRTAGCVINDVADRHLDAEVERTADRPLATGEVSVAEALVLFFGLLLIAAGLALTLNLQVLLFALGGAAIAVVYPLMKRVIAAPQLVLGVAFAWGVPMAYAAERGGVSRDGWLLFLAAMIWGIAYDTQYAMVDREDDLDAGVHSTAIMFGDMDRLMIPGLQLLFFVCMVLVGEHAALGNWYYGGLVVAALFAAYQNWLIRDRDRNLCLDAFKNNAWFGGAVFTGILLDYLFG